MRRKKKQKPLRHRGFAHKSGCFYRQTKGRRAPWVFLLLPHMVSSRNLINVARKKFAGKKRGRDESLWSSCGLCHSLQNTFVTMAFWFFGKGNRQNGSTCSSSTRIKSLTKHSSLHMQCLKMAHKVSVYRIVIKLLSFFALTGNLRMQFFGGKDSHQSVVAFSFHWISRQHRRE